MGDEVSRDITELKQDFAEHKHEIGDIQKALYTLIEAQKNTTRNVDTLSLDVKEMLKSSLGFDIVKKEVDLLTLRVNSLEESKNWGFKLIVGTVLTSVIGLLIGIKFKLI